jgi:hypothetical protein
MRIDVRIAFAAIALSLAACQGGGLDSGGMGGGMMGPPVQQPGPMGTGGMSGPQMNSSGQVELTQPGATLSPNEVQFAVGAAPNGIKCPSMLQQQQQFQQFACTLAFNIPPPSPTPSPGSSPKPTPTPTATPTPAATASGDSDDSDDSDSASASPTPPGTITLLMEPLPKDMPAMTNPDPRAMRITPMVAMRLQSDTNFALNGYATVNYTMPQAQFLGRSFAIQLYSESSLRGQRADQYLATYTKSTNTNANNTVQFSFPMPKLTVPRGQVWLLALYGMQFPPGMTPSPSPSPSASSSSSPAPSGSPSPTPSTGAST